MLAPSSRAQTQEGTLVASDPAFGDLLGDAMDLDGNTLAFGARAKNSGKGAIYVFRRGASWALEQKLTVATAANQDQVGSSIGLFSDLLVTGAPDPLDITGAASGPGTAYVFRRTGVTWAQEASLVASDGQAYDLFGYSVGTGNDVAVVGAPGDLVAGPGDRVNGSGAAYVFRKSGATWSQEAKLVASDAAAGDRGGVSVAIDGSLVVVGAPNDDGAATDTGAAYIFRKSGATWAQEVKLTASDAAAADGFGGAVAIKGNLVIVGAALKDGVGADSGAAYVFRNTTGTTWVQEAKLTASDAAASARYGFSVDVYNDEVAVGATGASAVYMHAKPAATWTQTAKLTDATASLLGYSVGLTPDFVASGAPFTTTSGLLLAGRGDVWYAADPPVVSSISPTSGTVLGGTTVTVNGSGFAQFVPKSVTFGGVAATAVTWVSASQLTCVSPTGTAGQVVSVAVTQNGSTSTLNSAYTYVGTAISSLSPNHGAAVGGNSVTITGSNFVNNGSTIVTFGGSNATINSITPPSTIVVAAPPGARGSAVNVTVSSSNGSATLTNGYTYDTLQITNVSKSGGNLLGGQSVVVTIDLPTNLADTTLKLGGVTQTINSLVGNQITFTVPAVTTPDGIAKDISVTNSNGTATASGAWTYTPSLNSAVAGNVNAGGTLTVSWVTDPAVGAGQLVTFWLGDPLVPNLFASVPQYAGRVQAVPLLFIVQSLTETATPLPLPFGPLPAGLAGFPFQFQALVTGEGGASGSFSNLSTFSIP